MAKRALLSVEYLICPVLIVNPVHHVERTLLQNGFDNSVTLNVAVHGVTLVRRADIELAQISIYGIGRGTVVVVGVSIRKVADGESLGRVVNWDET